MGETVLRRIQAGVETTRGVAVPATRRIYGTLTPNRGQAHRFAVEDRGTFVDKMRGNLKLVEAGGTIAADATFEDLPFYASLFLRGTATPSGSGLLGYTYTVSPDMTSDTLKTVTLEAGDESVSWQGPFGTVDAADFTLGLDEALTVSMATFTSDWVPQSYTEYPTSYTGFTAGVADHAVESVMGYQSSLYLDPAGATPGTTHITGRFIGATFGYHNQNKRKYFGDGTATFTKLGRGRRQVHCQVTFEAPDLQQYALYAKNQPVVARIAMTGTPITGSTGPVDKAMYFDFWGIFDTFTIGNRDTNTTFQFDLQAVYDIAAGKECAITVLNGNAAA
jgi:hypothetical protein